MSLNYDKMLERYGLASLLSSDLLPSVKNLKTNIDNLLNETNGKNIDDIVSDKVSLIDRMSSELAHKDSTITSQNSKVKQKIKDNIDALDTCKELVTNKQKDAFHENLVDQYDKGEITASELYGLSSSKEEIRDAVNRLRAKRGMYKEIDPENDEALKEDSHFEFYRYDDKEQTKQRVSVKEALSHNKEVFKRITSEIKEMQELKGNLKEDKLRNYLQSKGGNDENTIVGVGNKAIQNGEKDSVVISRMASYSACFNFIMEYNICGCENFKEHEDELRRKNVKFTYLDKEAIEANKSNLEVGEKAFEVSQDIKVKLINKYKEIKAQEQKIEEEKANQQNQMG